MPPCRPPSFCHSHQTDAKPLVVPCPYVRKALGQAQHMPGHARRPPWTMPETTSHGSRKKDTKLRRRCRREPHLGKEEGAERMIADKLLSGILLEPESSPQSFSIVFTREALGDRADKQCWQVYWENVHFVDTASIVAARDENLYPLRRPAHHRGGPSHFPPGDGPERLHVTRAVVVTRATGSTRLVTKRSHTCSGKCHHTWLFCAAFESICWFCGTCARRLVRRVEGKDRHTEPKATRPELSIARNGQTHTRLCTHQHPRHAHPSSCIIER